MNECPTLPFEEPEEWRSVPRWEDLYKVSDLGRVRSLDRMTRGGMRRGRILKPTAFKSGYLYVTFSRNNVPERWMVHRLVLIAFAGLPPAGHVACHGRDGGGRADNRRANLEWGTRPKNSGPDRERDGTLIFGGRNSLAKLTDESVREARERYAGGGVSTYSLAREFGVSRRVMTQAISGRSWTRAPGTATRTDLIQAGRPKLTPVLADEIRSKHASGRTQVSLAHEYSISRGNVNRIVHMRSWLPRT